MPPATELLRTSRFVGTRDRPVDNGHDRQLPRGLSILAAILELPVIEKILTHLGLRPPPSSQHDDAASSRNDGLMSTSLSGAGRRIRATPMTPGCTLNRRLGMDSRNGPKPGVARPAQRATRRDRRVSGRFQLQCGLREGG